MTNKEYQENELKRFRNEQSAYYDNLNDFIAYHDGIKKADVVETLEWIENGSYGAGACFQLQKVFNYVKDNNRVNKAMHIGNVLLKCLYGADFKNWNKLPVDMQKAFNSGVEKWLKSKKTFAQILEV
jgi:succinylarginine dihydrolase